MRTLAELAEGHPKVELDSDLLAMLGTDDGSSHVFLTPEGDTSGLYVSGRDARTFSVREQQNGTSSVGFSYRVVTKNRRRQPERFAKLEEPAETRYGGAMDVKRHFAVGRIAGFPHLRFAENYYRRRSHSVSRSGH